MPGEQTDKYRREQVNIPNPGADLVNPPYSMDAVRESYEENSDI
jgi:hypothetical protein